MSADATVDLITKAQAKAFLKITASSEDDIIDTLIHGASQAVVGFCGRDFVQATYTEYYDGSGNEKLILKNYPIVSVSSVNIDTTRQWGAASAVTVATDLIVGNDSGIIELWNNWRSFGCGKKTVRVVYSAGYASIPYDVQQACLLTVMYWYKRHYQDQRIGLQSETIGERNMTYSNEDLPKTAKLMLSGYVKRGWGSIAS